MAFHQNISITYYPLWFISGHLSDLLAFTVTALPSIKNKDLCQNTCSTSRVVSSLGSLNVKGCQELTLNVKGCQDAHESAGHSSSFCTYIKMDKQSTTTNQQLLTLSTINVPPLKVSLKEPRK